MGKGHYLGGGTLIGRGSLAKEKRGGRGGLGSGAALREQRRQELLKKRKAVSAKIKANEKLVKQIGQKWAAEKGRTHYTKLVRAERAKVSPLAEALQKALAKDSS